MTTATLLSNQTTTTESASIHPVDNQRNSTTAAFQAFGSVSAATGAADVVIQASNDETHWNDLNTISLTLGTTETSGVYAATAPYGYFRAKLSSISGTDAQVTVTVNY